MTSRQTFMGVIQRLIDKLLGSRLGIQSLRSALVRIVNVGLSLILSILLARILGVDGLGIYAGAMALVSLLAVPANSGVPTGLIQLISRYLAVGDLERARGLIRWGFGQVLGTALVISIVSMTIALVFFARDVDTISVYFLAFSLLPFLCLTSVQRAILNAFELSTLSLVPQDLVRPGLLSAILLVWLVFWPDIRGNAVIAMGWQVIAFVVTFLAGAFFLRRYGSRALSRGPRAYQFGQWYRMSLPFVMLEATAIVMAQTDIIMLSWWEPPASAGLYRIATSAALLVTLPAAAINTPLGPAVARLFQRQHKDELQKTLTISARWAFAGCLPIAFGLIVMGEWLLGFVFGPEFIAAYAVMVVLVLAQLFHVGAGPVGLVLQMTGHQKLAAKGILIATVVNVVLNAMLIPAFGILGAALATGASIVLWNALLLYGVVHKLNVDPTMVGRK